MTILTAILNAIRALTASVIQAAISNQKGFAQLNARMDDLKSGQEHTSTTVDLIWGAIRFEEAATITIPVAVDGEPQGDNDVKLSDSQKGQLGPIIVKDKKGADASLDGVPVWATSDETITTIQPSDDGLTGTVIGVTPGTCNYTVTGDADLGEGVTPIVGKGTITVTPGQAVTIDIPEGTPVDQ